MTQLEQFDATLTELNAQAEILKSIGGVYQKVNATFEQLDHIITDLIGLKGTADTELKRITSAFQETSKTVDKRLEAVDTTVKTKLGEFQQQNQDFEKKITQTVDAKLATVQKSLVDILTEYQTYKTEITKVLSEIKAENQVYKRELTGIINTKFSAFETTFTNLINTKIDEIRTENKNTAKQLSDLVEQLRQENKRFYIDFEQTMRIKLDESKSEIKSLIEQERSKIKDIIIEELDKRTSDILKQQQKLFNAVLAVGGVVVMGLGVAIFMLMKH